MVSSLAQASSILLVRGMYTGSGRDIELEKARTKTSGGFQGPPAPTQSLHLGSQASPRREFPALQALCRHAEREGLTLLGSKRELTWLRALAAHESLEVTSS